MRKSFSQLIVDASAAELGVSYHPEHVLQSGVSGQLLARGNFGLLCIFAINHANRLERMGNRGSAIFNPDLSDFRRNASEGLFDLIFYCVSDTGARVRA